MAIRRLFVVLALVVSGLFLAAGAASALDYPPTTSTQVTPAGNTVVPASTTTGGLPFTGGHDVVLVWVGAAFVGVGALAIVRTRTRRSHT